MTLMQDQDNKNQSKSRIRKTVGKRGEESGKLVSMRKTDTETETEKGEEKEGFRMRGLSQMGLHTCVRKRPTPLQRTSAVNTRGDLQGPPPIQDLRRPCTPPPPGSMT